jgi:beta-glucosidase
VTTSVTNTGPVTGAEVVQLYATTPDAPASAARPAKRLVGFAKVTVQPGQAVPVTLPVRVADLAFFDEQAGRYVVDPGRYGLELGSSNADIRQSVDLTVAGQLTAVPAVVTARPVAAGDSGIAQQVF